MKKIVIFFIFSSFCMYMFSFSPSHFFNHEKRFIELKIRELSQRENELNSHLAHTEKTYSCVGKQFLSGLYTLSSGPRITLVPRALGAAMFMVSAGRFTWVPFQKSVNHKTEKNKIKHNAVLCNAYLDMLNQLEQTPKKLSEKKRPWIGRYFL